MRHQMALRKFGRSSSHRKAMFRNLATALIEHERIETTISKAKDLRRVTEKLITLAGEDTVAARRAAYGYLNSKTVVHKLFAEIGPRFKARPGGYTRIIRSRVRAGDAAQLAVIELVAEEYKPKQKSKKRTTTKKATAKAPASGEQTSTSADGPAEE